MIKTNLKEKIFESGIDIGSSEIKCTIVEIDSINESVKLIGIGRSKTKGLKKGSISNREKLIDEIDYQLPLEPLGSAFGGKFTKEKIKQMFAYRRNVTKNDLKSQSKYLSLIHI